MVVTVKRSLAQKTGETAESLLESRLSKYGSVNKYQKDFGIDFACAMTLNDEHTGEEFLAQCKGTEKVSESGTQITLQLSCSTVRLWFKKRYLTFLFYVDLDKEEIYWVDPFPQLYEKIRVISDNQKSISIKISKNNLLDQKSESLPSSFIDSMHKFDEKLFSGELADINKDLDIFSGKDYFYDGLFIEDNEKSIKLKNQNINLVGLYADARPYNSKGNCLIQIIRHVKKAENDLTFSHEEILELFYFGKETSIKHNMRSYIKGYLKECGKYCIDLGNSRIYLYPNEVEDLCQVIDVFITRYVSKLTQFMKRIGNSGFEPYKKDFTNIKLLQIDLKLWNLITDYVCEHQSCNGKYEDGYIYTTFGNKNQIGLNDAHGKQVFNIRGKCVQSSFNPEKIVVDVVWEYMDRYDYYFNLSDNLFNVEETYLYFINMLIKGCTQEDSIVTQKKWILFVKKETANNIPKEEIENRYPKANYKLNLYTINFHHELGNIYNKLIQFLKEKKFYWIDLEALKLHCDYFNKCIQPTLTNYSDYTQNWFKQEKEETYKTFEQIRIKVKEKEPIEGFHYAQIFKYLESIIYEFKNSFNDNNLYFKELIQDLSNLITDYNEQQFVKLLIGKKY